MREQAESRIINSGWAIILGASSGFGRAIAIELAKSGMNIFGVHLDRKSTIKNAEETVSTIKSFGKEAIFFNVNVGDEEKREFVLDEVSKTLQNSDEKLRVLIHSVAFGTLKPLVSYPSQDFVTKAQIDMTLEIMANTLVYWTQSIVKRNLFAPNSRIYAMTSEGATRALENYGPVAAAKAAIESYIRQLAIELASLKITANAICAGVTETPALQKIPGHEVWIKNVSQRNPYRRLTTPQDVASTISALVATQCHWITGNTIYVDGGEHIAV